ncbi:hypothetical protein KY289_007941 [Solanum tuberosum]|nr:hypothetical protein KY289_007941 [Solanum tuberosum]
MKSLLLGGKEKVFEGNFAYDSDFEDEISLAKRLRVNNDACLKNVAGGSGSIVSKPLYPKGSSSTIKKEKVDSTVKELHFGFREFRTVTGFKCGGLMGFDHDPNTTSKLFSRYFPTASDKVLKAEFIRVFKEDGLIVEEDLFNMSMIYFISNYVDYDIGVMYDANIKYEDLITTIS